MDITPTMVVTGETMAFTTEEILPIALVEEVATLTEVLLPQLTEEVAIRVQTGLLNTLQEEAL